MATRSISRTDLVGLTSLSFIRPQTVSFSVDGTKPSTRMYAFFDGVSVDQYVTPSGSTQGAAIVTNAAGSVSGQLYIPPATFNTGNRVFRLQDTSDYNISSIPGSTVGSATATFSASGLLQTYQETITNITTQVIQIENNILDPEPEPVVVAEVPAVVTTVPTLVMSTNSESGGSAEDPLAQTFFTYGITGGCFVTKIDIYFQSKDSNIPVTLELRNVSNGYPASSMVSASSGVTLPPSSVNISNNASVATTFTFSRPIYLEEAKDYCFVLLTNSNLYNVWTSKLGEQSVETGKTIFEQPFIGSLFKSENNITWTAEQTEDIKFTLYKANFSPSASITFKANAQPTLIQGSDLSVTSGSPVVTLKFQFQHGHRTGDKIVLTGITNGNYRGISSVVISNTSGFTLTVVDDYTITFSVGANFTSTGTLASSGLLNSVLVDSSGSGYVSPSIAISGGSGTGATAAAVVVGGKIVSVTVTNQGTGYLSTPTLVLTDSSGTGAQLVPISETIFVSTINRKFQNVSPIVTAHIPPGSEISNSLLTSNEDYAVGSHQDQPLNTATTVGKDAVLVNPLTESTSFGSSTSTQMITNLYSNNSNISPVIDLGKVPKLRAYNFLINDTTNSTSELTPNSGTAYSRYLSKITTISTVSKGVRVIVSAASVITCSFDVFIRTSLSSNSVAHREGSFVKLNCDTLRNLSSSNTEYKDYTFYMDSISPFDAYDLKIVLYSANSNTYPIISNYRSIILAT